MGMDLVKVGKAAGAVLLAFGGVALLLSLFRLDGTGIAVGLVLGLYGVGVLLLTGVYEEVKALREEMERLR